MLSADRIRQIEQDATKRADSLSDEELRQATVRAALDHNDAPTGDERDALHLVDRIYTLALAQRKMSGQ